MENRRQDNKKKRLSVAQIKYKESTSTCQVSQPPGERDSFVQDFTRQIALNYDSRALQSPVVVSVEGLVLSGNARTMAGELAARDNTDGLYIDYLKNYCSQYGFTSDQVMSLNIRELFSS